MGFFHNSHFISIKNELINVFLESMDLSSQNEIGMFLKESSPCVLSLSIRILLHVQRNEMESATSAAIFCCYFYTTSEQGTEILKFHPFQK